MQDSYGLSPPLNAWSIGVQHFPQTSSEILCAIDIHRGDL